MCEQERPWKHYLYSNPETSKTSLDRRTNKWEYIHTRPGWKCKNRSYSHQNIQIQPDERNKTQKKIHSMNHLHKGQKSKLGKTKRYVVVNTTKKSKEMINPKFQQSLLSPRWALRRVPRELRKIFPKLESWVRTLHPLRAHGAGVPSPANLFLTNNSPEKVRCTSTKTLYKQVRNFGGEKWKNHVLCCV